MIDGGYHVVHVLGLGVGVVGRHVGVLRTAGHGLHGEQRALGRGRAAEWMPAHGEVRAVDSPAVGQDVCQSAFCAELTIALDERRVSLLTAGALVWTNLLEVLARGRLGSQIVGVQERTGLAGLADALTIEFAWDVCGAFELSRISVGAPLVLLLVPHALTLAVGRAAGPVEAAHAAHMALVAVLHAVLYGDALLGLLGGTLDLAVLAAAEVARVAVGDAVAVGRGLGRELGSKGGHVGVGERRRGIVGWACRVLRRREEGLGRRRLGLAFGGHGASESWPCGAGRGCSSVREGDVVGALRAVEEGLGAGRRNDGRGRRCSLIAIGPKLGPVAWRALETELPTEHWSRRRPCACEESGRR